MRILVKIGGAQLGDSAAIAQALGAARAVGHEIVLVHGGGLQVREWSQRLGLGDSYVQGLRVTDAATAQVVTAVLGGEVNRNLVKTLCLMGVPAVGLTGADGNIFQATPKRSPKGLGFVGEVSSVQPGLLNTLLEQGYTPVIASIAPGSARATDPLFNINADEVVGPLAQAIKAEAVLFLTDVAGVQDATGKVCETLDPGQTEALTQEGVIQGGMLPKTSAGFAALQFCPGALVKIAPAQGRESILAALSSRVGTRFVPGPPTPETRNSSPEPSLSGP